MRYEIHTTVRCRTPRSNSGHSTNRVARRFERCARAPVAPMRRRVKNAHCRDSSPKSVIDKRGLCALRELLLFHRFVCCEQLLVDGEIALAHASGGEVEGSCTCTIRHLVT